MLQNAIKERLSYIDAFELSERISKFRDLDFRKMSRDDVYKSVRRVLEYHTSAPDNEVAMVLTFPKSVPVGARVYRIRKLKSDRCVPLREITIEADAWEPPAHAVSAGRLNQTGEPLFYCTPDFRVALEEMDIGHGELFPMFVYNTIRPLDLVSIGLSIPNIDVSPDEKLKLKMLMDFLRHEFIRDVGKGKEYLYKVSEVIAKKFSGLGADSLDGWEYPSVARKGGVNACLHPLAARKKLALQGFILARADIVNDEYNLKVFSVAHGFDAAGKFIYHPFGGNLAKRVFPEVR
jgi:hypothetical protein